MGRTGNMIIKDFVRQMCVPLENSVYFDGDSFNSNADSAEGNFIGHTLDIYPWY